MAENAYFGKAIGWARQAFHFVIGLDRTLLVSFFVIVTGLYIAGNLASEVVEGDTLSFDSYLIGALRDPADLASPLGPRWLEKIMVDFTALGGGPVLTLVTILVAGYLLAIRKWATALFVVVATAGGGLAANLLKLVFGRERPDVVPHLVPVDSGSFPSAHAMNSAVVFLTLGVLLAGTQKDWRVKAYLMSAAILLTLMIGASRVYLGVHWPSDVAVGWTVGAAWAFGCSLVADILRRRHSIEECN